MNDPYLELTKTLNRQQIFSKDYLKFLDYLIEGSYEKLTTRLQAQGLDLTSYLKYLDTKQQATFKLLAIQTGETVEDDLGAYFDMDRIKKIGLKVLVDGRIGVAELNDILEEALDFEDHIRVFLQLLLRNRKIMAEEFLELERDNFALPEDIPAMYQIRSKRGKPEFYIDQKKDPRFFGNYQILEEIARGGMGIVYKAYHPMMNQIYALKVLLAGEEASERAVQRFQREVKVVAQLKHPGIVQIIDSGVKDNNHYFVMEFIEGIDLNQAIVSGLPLREGLEIIQKSLEALHYAHENKILHRDIKPQNIFLTKEGKPKIGDFGLAKDTRLDSKSQKITQSGILIGSPSYMSPEQASGEIEKLDTRSDIYSMGACLYQILTERCPFESPVVFELLYNVLNEAAAPPSKWNPNLHRDLDTITLKALEKSPEKRYQTALEFANDIERFLKGYPINAKPISNIEKFSKWLYRNTIMVMVGSVIVILCFVALIYSHYLKVHAKTLEFQRIVNEATQERELAQALSAKGEQIRRQKVQHYLNAFHLLNNALVIRKAHYTTEKNKFEVGQELILLACLSQEYQLASYVTKELQELYYLPQQEKKKLVAKVKTEQTKILAQHLKSFEAWAQKLKTNPVAESRKEAIFEISRMKEEEIYQQLLQQLSKGTNYFLQKEEKEASLAPYYETMVKCLGRMTRPESAPYLMESLTQMKDKLVALPEAKRSLTELNYMISLTQALCFLEEPRYIKALRQLRGAMGKNNIFWNRTQKPYKRLLEKINLTKKDLGSANEYIIRGLAKFDKGDVKGAIEDYTKALALSPEEIFDIYNLRAAAKHKAKLFEAAISDYTLAVKLNPNDPILYCNRGHTQYVLKRYQEALKDFDIALTLAPEYVDAYNNRGYTKHASGDILGAIDDYTLALKYNPLYATAYLNRGNANNSLKKWREALADYSKTIELDPNYTSAYRYRGVIKYNLKDFEGAIADYNEAIRIEPKNPSGYNHRGFVKFAKRDFKGAILDYDQAINLAPKYILAFYNRGNAYYALKDTYQTIQNYNKALKLKPAPSFAAKIYYRRGIIKYAKKDFQSALNDFNLALRNQPKYAEAYYKRALIYHARNELQKAIDDYSITIKFQPNYWMAYHNRGSAKYSLNDRKGALKDFDFLLTQPFFETNALIQQLKIYKKERAIDQIILLLERILKTKQQPELKREWLELLYQTGLSFYQKREYQKARINLLKFKQTAASKHPYQKAVRKMLQEIDKKVE